VTAGPNNAVAVVAAIEIEIEIVGKREWGDARCVASVTCVKGSGV
jgi:hypothetical protein